MRQDLPSHPTLGNHHGEGDQKDKESPVGHRVVVAVLHSG